MTPGPVDFTVLRVSRHAMRRYCERIMGAAFDDKSRAIARRRLETLLRYGESLRTYTWEGCRQEAIRLKDCVVIAKNGVVTTVYTQAQYTRKLEEGQVPSG